MEWFNRVDATYRLDLRELNDLNYARFEAKLEQRLAELKAELRTEFHAGLSDLRAEVHALRRELASELASQKAELVKWMFLFWVGTALTVVGLLKL